jgi:hypothetical protein
MLHHRTRSILAVAAPLFVAGALVVATPERAAGQGSVGFGITIQQGWGRQLPPPPPLRGMRYQPRNDRYYQVAYRNGYTDGYEKGIEDGRRWRSFDPNRHRRYRNADHYYDRRYGPRFEYESAYRDGFISGYQIGYQETGRYRGYSRGNDPRRRPY